MYGCHFSLKTLFEVSTSSTQLVALLNQNDSVFVSKTRSPVAGLAIMVLWADVNLGTSTPLLVLVISNAALELGELVPIPI